jgi:hypothetical protein
MKLRSSGIGGGIGGGIGVEIFCAYFIGAAPVRL